VFAKEGLSTRGEQIIQPSQGDTNCVMDLANDLIGQLSDFVPFTVEDDDIPSDSNYMDCALIEVLEAADPDGNLVPAVDACTPEDGYGFPSRRILRSTRIGQQVQKYGRTTVYTRGVCQGINTISLVGYTLGNVEFPNNHLYLGMAPVGSLGAPGDSGSLIVTLEDRRPVSLLFAGGGGTTLGNPIGPILDRFNVSIDDGLSPAPRATGAPGNTGASGRGGVAIGQLGQNDVALLPPELRGRIKNPKGGIVPIQPTP
jgi:hypothetical protein